MRKSTRTGGIAIAALAAITLAIGSSTAAYAGTEYFWDSPDNTETGSPLGTDATGNPLTWESAHSQFAGDTTTSLRLSAQQDANWTFLWTREDGDDSAYRMVPQFTIDQGYAAPVAMEVGFDTAYSHTQVAWPSGYWVSNDEMWQRPIDTTPATVGTHDLNTAGESVTIPANVDRVYLRLQLQGSPSSGVASVTDGDVSFTPVVLDDDDDISTLPTRNVVTLGADPTGVVDATDIIQSAVDDGGTIFFPAGTYKITRTIELTKSYTELYGEAGSTIQVPAGSPVTAITNSPAYGVWNLHHISIHDLRIANDPLNTDPGNNLQFTQGIALKGVRDSSIHDVELSEFQHDNIYIAYSRNVTVQDVDSQGARHGITVQGHYDGGRYGNWDISVDRIHTRDNWDTGVVIGFYNHRVSLTNSTIEGSWAHGVDIFNSEDITVRGNRVLNWNAPHGAGGTTMLGQTVGIFVHPDWGISTNPPTARIDITENEIRSDVVFPSGVTPNAIEITGNTEDVVVSHNIISGGHRGVYVREQTYDTYWVNRPDQTPAVGGDIPRDITISDNTVSGQSGTYLMLETSAAMPTSIEGNSFSGASTVGVTLTAPTASLIALTGNSFFGGGATSSTETSNATWTGNSYLSTPASPTVTTQPQDEVAAVGTIAVFTAGAVSSTAHTVQWQSRANSSASWADVSGASAAVLLVPVSSVPSATQFRAVFDNASGTANSSAATLTRG